MESNLALFLKDIILKDKPRIVVIGGNIAKAFNHFADALKKNLEGVGSNPSIKKAVLGEEALLNGAASCWHEVEVKVLASADM